MDKLLQCGTIHIILRIFFTALSAFDDSIEDLEKFLIENENRNVSVSDFDLSTQSNENEKNLLLALMSMIKSSKSFQMHQYREILENHPQLAKLWENHQTFIESFLLHLSQVSDLSFHGIFSGSSRKVNSVVNPSMIISSMQQPIGYGALLFGSGINHSCSNNVFRVCVEGKVAYIVCQPIRKGAQLFDCYK